ncbi:hypothetical protein RB594_008897 [Gaeumannomyces avenae]
MPVVHVVLMAFDPAATPQETDKIVQSMLALKDKCIHPATQKPYVSTKGGVNLTSEGFAGGYSHSFIMEFETEEEYAYYNEKDPAHLELIENMSSVVSKALVVDFNPGVF